MGNLTLLCGYHHRDFERRGWQVSITGGLPTWTPPAWLDPTRTPISNTTQHMIDIDFGAHTQTPDRADPPPRQPDRPPELAGTRP